LCSSENSMAALHAGDVSTKRKGAIGRGNAVGFSKRSVRRSRNTVLIVRDLKYGHFQKCKICGLCVLICVSWQTQAAWFEFVIAGVVAAPRLKVRAAKGDIQIGALVEDVIPANS